MLLGQRPHGVLVLGSNYQQSGWGESIEETRETSGISTAELWSSVGEREWWAVSAWG